MWGCHTAQFQGHHLHRIHSTWVAPPRVVRHGSCCCCCCEVTSVVSDSATPETAAHQAPLSLGFSRQEHWSGLPFPSPMHESEKWKWSRSVVSDSKRPHGLQRTRLLRPWDFPGKSTGVGCHCLLRWDMAAPPLGSETDPTGWNATASPSLSFSSPPKGSGMWLWQSWLQLEKQC